MIEYKKEYEFLCTGQITLMMILKMKKKMQTQELVIVSELMAALMWGQLLKSDPCWLELLAIFLFQNHSARNALTLCRELIKTGDIVQINLHFHSCQKHGISDVEDFAISSKWLSGSAGSHFYEKTFSLYRYGNVFSVQI